MTVVAAQREEPNAGGLGGVAVPTADRVDGLRRRRSIVIDRVASEEWIVTGTPTGTRPTAELPGDLDAPVMGGNWPREGERRRGGDEHEVEEGPPGAGAADLVRMSLVSPAA